MSLHLCKLFCFCANQFFLVFLNVCSEEKQQKTIKLLSDIIEPSLKVSYTFSQEKFTPVKYFSIDRVFRNETTDATHLAEFHQIEGVVADYGLTLGHLMGIIQEFFKKLNITKLRFKPTYNPYTEPSMELFSYHDGMYLFFVTYLFIEC